MKRFATLTAAALITLTSASLASALERVRGTIEKADGGSLVIKTEAGGTETVEIGSAKFVSVVPSNLDAIKDGVFIGTATKGENPMTALEVVLFPESMRGTGEGHYGWDAITDQTAGGGAKVKSAMTNGTVKAEAANAPKVKSTMTNGTVKADTAAADGARTLTVGYGKDGTKTIVVPPSAPIVAFEPADKAVLAPGAKVFAVVAKEGGKTDGKLVAVGKNGLTPPM
ncbi:metal ABC transporter permease [Methylobacterium sp. NEAU 140]|uniref:metal ABC transporter permease n=1 Tax=Methylobacterium sp. NEAU 140 TaxID=3064945 RepID=UPI0027333C52|nr:metal ABC transporter permease [Methylobacterium sp. NEAU 140]MDP4025582.1 metal ABC transporter permease [Methylobacterium sp. NEAU 140]